VKIRAPINYDKELLEDYLEDPEAWTDFLLSPGQTLSYRGNRRVSLWNGAKHETKAAVLKSATERKNVRSSSR
jgi:hypothetical protein